MMAELRKDFEARHELFWATLSELKKEVEQVGCATQHSVGVHAALAHSPTELKIGRAASAAAHCASLAKLDCAQISGAEQQSEM